ncbi:MAG: NAD(P)H-binding protein, partial [Dehalococcoidia bacterium]|nr:NAD(P)H-binding protein [Dehalococcoidia bacterium]
LGRALLPALLAAGFEVRALVRRPDASLPPGVTPAAGDLTDGAGLAEAVRGVDAIVHLASGSAGGDTEAIDIEGTARLLEAAHASGSPHLLYLSIVGIDRTPLPYYAVKMRVEEQIAASGLPWTSLRTTQFHELIAEWLERRAPVFARGVSFQPVSTADVSNEVVWQLRVGPTDAIVEFGGPEVLTSEALASTFAAATGAEPLAIGEAAARSAAAAFAGGNLLAPEHAFGRITWGDWLAARG